MEMTNGITMRKSRKLLGICVILMVCAILLFSYSTLLWDFFSSVKYESTYKSYYTGKTYHYTFTEMLDEGIIEECWEAACKNASYSFLTNSLFFEILGKDALSTLINNNGGFVFVIPNLLTMIFPLVFYAHFRKGYKKHLRIYLVLQCVLIAFCAIGFCRRGIRLYQGSQDYNPNLLYLLGVPSIIEIILLLLFSCGIGNRKRSLVKGCFIALCAFGVLLLVLHSPYCNFIYDVAGRTPINEALDNILISVKCLFVKSDMLGYYWRRHTADFYEPFTCFIYALIAYRALKVKDMHAADYPEIAWGYKKPVKTSTGGEIVMGNKSKVIAAVLAFFLGGTGAHRYYLGYKKQGAIQTCGCVSMAIGYAIYIPAMMGESAGTLLFAALLLLFGAVTSFWAFIDFIRILTGSLVPEDGAGYAENRPAQVQVVQSAPSASDNMDALEKMAKLREQGVLTEDEFQQKKADILGYEYIRKPTTEAKPQVDKQWTCVKCDTTNKKAAKFCSQCGEIRHFDWVCSKCNEHNSAKARFCCNCGVSQEESERIKAEEEERKRREEERRLREEEERKRREEEERRLREEEERKRREEERKRQEEEERRIRAEEERKRLEEERRLREEEERKRREEEERRHREEEERKRREEEERRLREEEERKRLEEEERRLREEEHRRLEEERIKEAALKELKNQGFDYPHPLKYYDGICPKCGLKHYNNRPNCVRCGSRFKQEE